MTELRRRMIQDMELRGLKENTQKTYVDTVKHLAQHYGRSPDRLSEEELRQHFVCLSKDRRCAKSTLRLPLSAIKFLFRHTLQRPLPPSISSARPATASCRRCSAARRSGGSWHASAGKRTA